MKKRILRCMAFMLVMIMALPVLPSGVAQAAKVVKKPSLSSTSKTIIGTDATFTVNLLNAGSNIKRMTWYTQNDEVAIIEPTDDPMTAKVTTIGKGVTNVKCKITYKDGSVARPYCKVTVKIRATAIEINNAQDDELNNNRHVIAVGDKFNFNSTKTPSNASDKTYWVIDNGKGDTQYASVISNGTVTGLKPGIVRLSAIASMTQDGIEDSKIKDTINIEIVPKTVGVKEIKLEDTTTLKVTFDNPIDASTVIGANSKLLNSIILTPKTDANNKLANGLGELKATLSTDGKTLTITSQYNFNGLYGIQLTTGIKGTDGVALQEYFKNLELYDKTAPSFKNYTVDGTGLIVTINFTEAMDFSNMDVLSAKVLDAGKDMLSTTAAILVQEANYKKSADNKSLTIDLTSMSLGDQNKTFAVSISNIKDLAGNYPTQYPHTVYFKTDTTPKPQAQLITVTRTGYDTLTATFTRPIKTVGNLTINNNDFPQGKVDATDPTKVNYTLTSTSVLLTGIQNVYIGNWDSYNVSPSDYSAKQMYTRPVDFTVDKTAPALISNALTQETINGVVTNVLTLTYNKKVSLLSDSGAFISKLVTTNNDIYSNKPINYTAYVNDTKVIVLISSTLEGGVYNVTIPANFVKDIYMNMSAETHINIVKTADLANPLPAPKTIEQQVNAPGVVELKFDQKLDPVSAQTLTNYHIAGVTLQSAVLMDNSDTGARVILTAAPGTITASTVYPITVKGIKGFNNTYAEMIEYTIPIFLYENTVPTLNSCIFTYPTTITLTFSEAISGTTSFQVLQGSTDLTLSSVINGDKVIISLKAIPVLGSTPLQIIPTQSNIIKDAAGNIAIVLPRYIPAVSN